MFHFEMLLLNVSKRVETFAEMSDEPSAKMNSVIFFESIKTRSL